MSVESSETIYLYKMVLFFQLVFKFSISSPVVKVSVITANYCHIAIF